jgi:Fe-S-cluster containining protein
MTNRNDPCPCGSGKKYKKCCGVEPGPSKQDPISVNRAIAYLGDIGRRREAFCLRYMATKKDVTHSIEQGLQRDASALNQTISCSKGCGDCCAQYYVAASLQECEAIVYWLYRHEDILRHFLRAIETWRGKVSAIAPTFNVINSLYGKNILSKMTEEEKLAFRAAMDIYEGQHVPCPFLINGACSIYEVRPYVCAGVVSVSPPAWCGVAHPDHGQMKYLKTEMRLENDMPYFAKLKNSMFFGSMPLLVNDILSEGYAVLSSIPGLEGLQQAALNDPEVRTALRDTLATR